MFPYSVAYGTHAAATGNNSVGIGANPKTQTIQETVTVINLGWVPMKDFVKLVERVDELERETAVVGALEDTVRLLVAEVEELKRKNQVKKIFSYDHEGILV